MRAQIVAIGNSRGVRIPKVILSQLRLEGEVELSVKDATLVVRPVRRPRAGWEQVFAKAGGKLPLDPEHATTFDQTEWQW